MDRRNHSKDDNTWIGHYAYNGCMVRSLSATKRLWSIFLPLIFLLRAIDYLLDC